MKDFNFQINHNLKTTEAFFRNVISKKFLNEDVTSILKGLQIASSSHLNQERSDGNPYIIHPIRVALLLMKFHNPTTSEMIIAALLHDSLEDTELTEDDISKEFKEPVLTYVNQLTRYRPVGETASMRMQGKTDKFKKIMDSKIEIRAIKTFDYLDNLISIKFISVDKPHYKKIPRWIMEANSLYLPLASITNDNAYKLMQDELSYYSSKGFKIGDWFDG